MDRIGLFYGHSHDHKDQSKDQSRFHRKAGLKPPFFFSKSAAIAHQEAEREGMEAFSAGHRRLR